MKPIEGFVMGVVLTLAVCVLACFIATASYVEAERDRWQKEAVARGFAVYVSKPYHTDDSRTYTVFQWKDSGGE